jgi:hypothetical protein
MEKKWAGVNKDKDIENYEKVNPLQEIKISNDANNVL